MADTAPQSPEHKAEKHAKTKAPAADNPEVPGAEAEASGEKGEKKEKRKKIKRSVPKGIAHVHSSFNNTIVTISDTNGDVLGWASGGTMNFKGSRKGTPFAAQRAASDVADRCKARFGLREIEVRIQGPGPGADSAVRGLQSAGVEVKSIEDVSSLPHNGCRPRKKRRV